VLASQWASLLSPLSTSSEEYELAQAAVLESQLFRLFTFPSTDAIQEIISRMAMADGNSPEMTAQMLLNKEFVRTFSKAKSEMERTEIFEDYFYGTFVVDLEERNTKLQNEIHDLRSQMERLNMTEKGDTYNIGQAGAVGHNPHAHNMNFVQGTNSSGTLNIENLAKELSKLREELTIEAQTPEQTADIGLIALAEREAKNGNESKALEYLSKAGKWVLGVAEKIGIALVVGLLKDSITGK
jgi:hypothetical protein